ncbi:MAG: hypothetical protein GY864_07130 [Desulfobacterales bacterium]|nr:hypothetical protein [Desulfobacterales bacterium]
MKTFLVIFLLILFAGCGSGSIYTHTIKPLDINLKQIPTDDLDAFQGNIKHVRYYMDVMWDSNSIGDIYKKSGFSTIYYADIETFKILGIWSQYKVYVYGR